MIGIIRNPNKEKNNNRLALDNSSGFTIPRIKILVDPAGSRSSDRDRMELEQKKTDRVGRQLRFQDPRIKIFSILQDQTLKRERGVNRCKRDDDHQRHLGSQ